MACGDFLSHRLGVRHRPSCNSVGRQDVAHTCRERALTAGPLEGGIPGHSAYPDKVTMRVHVSLREDIRLWGWAFGGAVLLFAVIVVLGIAPSPFPSVDTGQGKRNRTIVVAEDATSTPLANHRPLSRSTPTDSTRSRGNVPVAGGAAVVAGPGSPSAQRPTPTPVKPTHTPDAPTKPGPASPPVTAAAPTPPVALPPGLDPGSVVPPLPPVPPLPTVTVPPLPDPTGVVPTVPLP
jgi:hypothetical protein